MVFAEFASASFWLRTNISQIMANKRIVAMHSVLLLLSLLAAYIIILWWMCDARMLCCMIYIISRPTEIALLRPPYQSFYKACVSKQLALLGGLPYLDDRVILDLGWPYLTCKLKDKKRSTKVTLPPCKKGPNKTYSLECSIWVRKRLKNCIHYF